MEILERIELLESKLAVDTRQENHLLSRAYHPIGYAACTRCGGIWLDDVPLSGSLRCPVCPEFRGAVVRGLRTYDEAKEVREKSGRQT